MPPRQRRMGPTPGTPDTKLSRLNPPKVSSKKSTIQTVAIKSEINIVFYAILSIAQSLTLYASFFYQSPTLLQDPLTSIARACSILGAFQLLILHLCGFITQERIKVTILVIIHVVLATFAAHSIAILYGAPVVKQIPHTFLFALFISLLCVPAASSMLKVSSSTWIRLFCAQQPQSSAEHAVYWPTVLGIICAWLGAVPIPLDWDRPWQAWPVTCVLGGLAGHSCGIIVGVVMATVIRRR